MSRLFDTFRDEAAELLQELETALLALEESPAEPKLVDRVFRAMHTLKGAAGLVGFENVTELCHAAETVFEQVRAGEWVIDRELVDLTLAAKDQLKALVEAEFGGSAADAGRTAELLSAFVTGHQIENPVETVNLSSACSSRFTYRIRFRPAPSILHQGIQPQLLLNELARLGEALIVAQCDRIPPLDQLEPEECLVHWDVILTTAEDENAIRDVFIFVEDDCELTIDLIDAEGLLEGDADYKRLGEILVERGDLPRLELDALLSEKKRLGEMLIDAGRIDPSQVEAALVEQERVQRLRRERQALEATDSIRVKSERLDKLVNLVGELVTVQARLGQIAALSPDSDLFGVSEEVERLIWELRDQVLTIRMLPIGSTFSRFKRLVRDLGQELGKDVILVTEGGDTELDKTVIERLGDPLVHLIRNSIDHGIESPAARKAAGKPPKGRITLAAEHSGANVLITVADDGAGLDRERILAMGVERGLVAPQTELGERDLYNLIFLPGFSTAGQISSVSGRGVGMDVVGQTVDALRGTIEVSSEPGRGTRFVIRLPLTLAIIDGLLVAVGDERFILPLADVEECIELTSEVAQASHGRNLVQVRGEIVPYVPLRQSFGIRSPRPEIEQVVIARLESGRIGFAVDHVIGENQTVIKNLGRFYQDLRGLSGATILGDGRVALILDLAQLAEQAVQNERSSCH